MKVGMLTAPFGKEPIEIVLDFAEEAAIPCLEVMAQPGSKHLDPVKFDAKKAAQLKTALDTRGLEISALAYYEVAITNPKQMSRVQ